MIQRTCAGCGVEIPPNRQLCPSCWRQYGAKRSTWAPWLREHAAAIQAEIDQDRKTESPHIAFYYGGALERTGDHGHEVIDELEYRLNVLRRNPYAFGNDPGFRGGSYQAANGEILPVPSPLRAHGTEHDRDDTDWTEIDQRVDLLKAVKTLPPHLREVVALTLENFEQDDIAARLGCSQSTVSRRLNQAIDLIKLAYEST